MARGRPFLFTFLFLFLFLFLAQSGVQAAPVAKTACPPDAEVRRTLNVGSSTPVACRVRENDSMAMAAVVPPAGPTGKPHVFVVVRYGNHIVRGKADLPGTGRADDWKVAVDDADILGVNWLRVDVTAVSGDDLFDAHTVVSFFKGSGKILRHLWTGPGDRLEVRFDACRLETVSHFELSERGALVRTRHTTRTFLERTDIDADDLSTLRTGCIAAPPTDDAFVVADDGIDADGPISPALRAHARENRRLFLRARRSPKDLGRFIAHSMALVSELGTQAMNAPSPDPDLNEASASTSGAHAYMMDSSGRSGLDWNNIRAVAGPDGRALAGALAEFRNDEGVWISARNDYGGCHEPEQATDPLRRLVEAWNAASAAVRAAFEPVVVAYLREMDTDACFCVGPGQKEKLQQALDRNAGLLERLVGPGPGPDAAAALRALLSDRWARFNCSPG